MHLRALSNLCALSARGSARGFYPKEWNKWKNHFNEMKGDVGMSSHEKEKEQEDAYAKTESH